MKQLCYVNDKEQVVAIFEHNVMTYALWHREILFHNFRRQLSTVRGWTISIFGNGAFRRTSVHQWYRKFNRGRSLIQDVQEVHEDRPWLVAVSKVIDAARKLKLQDRDVAYRENETILGISGINIHSILYQHLSVKRFMSIKVNSSRLNGYFKMSQIQPKFFAHKALTSRWPSVILEKLDM